MLGVRHLSDAILQRLAGPCTLCSLVGRSLEHLLQQICYLKLYISVA